MIGFFSGMIGFSFEVFLPNSQPPTAAPPITAPSIIDFSVPVTFDCLIGAADVPFGKVNAWS